MPSDYPLEHLGPEDFQRLAQALLLQGEPWLQVLPVAQPDGGRDAFAWIAQGGRHETVVFQVKFHRKPQSVASPHKWLLEILVEEAPKVAKLVDASSASAYVLITNIPGTSHLDVGSIDRAQEILDRTLDVPAQCWWRDDVVRRLDGNQALHWAFPQLLTGADILKSVVENGLSEDRDRRSAALRAFLARQHEDDVQVRFREVELEIPLLEVFVDVPTAPRGGVWRRTRDRFRRFYHEPTELGSLWPFTEGFPSIGDKRAFRYVSTFEPMRRTREGLAPVRYAHLSGEQSEVWPYLDPDAPVGAASLLLDPDFQQVNPLVVMEGAPGQGKSTLVQYLCQVHRMRLLGKSLYPVTEDHRNRPPRLPFKVDLRDYALWLRKENPFLADEPVGSSWTPSLESFLAAQVYSHSGGIEFSVADLAAVLRLSSTLLVLDGLDEVPDTAVRAVVVDELTKAIQRLSELSLTLQVVVTSRPAAFANSPGFSPELFRYYELASITSELITEYSERWMRARRLPPSAAQDVKRILKTKLDQPHMRDLARNPMQLTILLSLIHTRGASLPDKRTALYDAYVDTFFSREAEKSLAVRENRDLLVDIHRYVAWLLHAETEMASSDGRITSDRLKEVVAAYLASEGYDPHLAEVLFDSMVQRVVALVSRIEGTYEFEVQPLREYFAARHLYETAPYAPAGADVTGTLPERFDAVIRNRYWLNVARFLAGCYSKGELASLVESLKDLHSDERFERTLYPRQLARMLLSDWVFSQAPRLVDPVVGLMADATGLKLLQTVIAPARDPNRAVVLPAGSGREGLLRRCLTMLGNDLPRDFESSIALIARSNSDEDALRDTWLKCTLETEGESRTRWVAHGLRLGVLHRLSSTEMGQVMRDAPSDVRRLVALMRAGHVDFCEMDPKRATALVDAALAGMISVAPHERKIASPIVALNRAVNQTAFALKRGDNRAFELIPFRSGEPSATSGARKVSEVFATAIHLPEAVWLGSLDPWNAIVEEGRSIFGERWAWTALAFYAASLHSHTSVEKADDLLDSATPLCHRAAYARSRTGAMSWWTRTLDAAAETLDRQLALALALAWTGPKTLARLLPKIDEGIRTLTDEEFEQIARCFAIMSGPPRSARLSVEEIGEIDPRTSTLLGRRLKENAVRALHWRITRQYAGGSTSILRERVEMEVVPALERGQDWDSALELAQCAYRAGAWIPRDVAGGQRDELVRVLPVAVARRVLDDALRYPTELVSMAEARIDRDVTEEVRPVGVIARDEGWFTEHGRLAPNGTPPRTI